MISLMMEIALSGHERLSNIELSCLNFDHLNERAHRELQNETLTFEIGQMVSD